MLLARLLLGLFLQFFTVDAFHFRGGSISWRPLNNTPSGSTVSIIVTERFAWQQNAFNCTTASIAAQTPRIGDAVSLACVSGTCSSWTSMSIQTPCTDFNVLQDIASGEYSQVFALPPNIAFSISYNSCCWINTLAVGGNARWSVVGRISTATRPDGYLNTSPVAFTVPVIYKPVGTQFVHSIQMADFDGTDTLRCRWSSNQSSTINTFDECGGMCNGVPNAILYPSNCTMVFTLTAANMYAGVALQIEDYYNNASITAMSSVPLQFLFYGYTARTGCATPPAIIGNRPNRACIGAPFGTNITEYIAVQVFCPGKTIVDLISTSPLGMTKSPIMNPNTGIYQIVFSWTPVPAQFGIQGLCVSAVDNTSVQSDQHCLTFLAGFQAPNFVPGSATPVGVIFPNQTIFSIQVTQAVFRPTRSNTTIYFTDATTNTLVQTFDCASAQEMTYSGSTIGITFPVAPWIPGHSYYITFDSGMTVGTELCGPESAPISSPSFWTFNVPSLTTTTTASTTSTSSTTGTTGTTSTTVSPTTTSNNSSSTSASRATPSSAAMKTIWLSSKLLLLLMQIVIVCLIHAAAMPN